MSGLFRLTLLKVVLVVPDLHITLVELVEDLSELRLELFVLDVSLDSIQDASHVDELVVALLHDLLHELELSLEHLVLGFYLGPNLAVDDLQLDLMEANHLFHFKLQRADLPVPLADLLRQVRLLGDLSAQLVNLLLVEGLLDAKLLLNAHQGVLVLVILSAESCTLHLRLEIGVLLLRETLQPLDLTLQVLDLSLHVLAEIVVIIALLSQHFVSLLVLLVADLNVAVIHEIELVPLFLQLAFEISYVLFELVDLFLDIDLLEVKLLDCFPQFCDLVALLDDVGLFEELSVLTLEHCNPLE